MLNVHNYCNILMKIGFSRQIFQKYSNTKFNGSPLSGIRVVPCGRTDGQKQTDIHDEEFFQLPN
jgi:hypothetical protein